ncbi:MAG: RNA methyltransferase [Patescibacteria group bacterium]
MTPREKRLHDVVRARRRGIRIILEDIHDPHNAGAIMRTADAFGIQEVWFIFAQEKPYNPRRVGKGSSSSANKWLSFRIFQSTEDCVAALAVEECVSVATTLHGGVPIGEVALESFPEVALWVGNEHRGLSEVAIASAAVRVLLPMEGMVESLNVSVATALCIQYLVGARIRAGKDERLTDTEATALAQEFLAR